MPTLLFQIITIIADIVIFLFVGIYLLRIRYKEKTLAEKESKIDTEYHKVVDNALTRERKILEDATAEADQIISGAEYITNASKDAINKTLQSIVGDIQKEALETSRTFMTNYQDSLKQLATQSLGDFQNVTNGLGADLQKQINEFHSALLPKLEKELEDYKEARLKETDLVITKVIQRVSQEVLNKSIPLSDHQALLVDSLEKAKKEGIFE